MAHTFAERLLWGRRHARPGEAKASELQGSWVPRRHQPPDHHVHSRGTLRGARHREGGTRARPEEATASLTGVNVRINRRVRPPREGVSSQAAAPAVGPSKARGDPRACTPVPRRVSPPLPGPSQAGETVTHLAPFSPSTPRRPGALQGAAYAHRGLGGRTAGHLSRMPLRGGVEPGREQVWAPQSAGRRLVPSTSWLRTRGRAQVLTL